MQTIAINGFGRIGRLAARILHERNRLDRLVAVNDLADAETLAYLLKYDSNYGQFREDIRAVAAPSSLYTGAIRVGHHVIGVTSQKEPAQLPWGELGVSVVIESTGRFTERAAASEHLKAGAKQVIISAPSHGDNPAPTSVIGVNAGTNDEPVINNASCTTNSIAPIMQVMHKQFGIQKSLMTTIHAYTQSQSLQDGPAHEIRESRAAAENIVPTLTGAAIAATEAIPELAGRFDGVSVRVPVPVGSLSDVTLLLNRDTSVEEINHVLTEAAASERYKGIIEVSSEPLVSRDIIGSSASVIVDLGLTRVVAGNLVKIFGWYDNEWGYANRLVDQALRLTQTGEQE